MCKFAHMKKSKEPINRISMAIAMLFISLAIYAQRFVNTSLEGAQSVCAITQDSDGMIWLGTDNGLYSYDGYHGYRHFQEHTFSNTRVNALGFEGRMLGYWQRHPEIRYAILSICRNTSHEGFCR